MTALLPTIAGAERFGGGWRVPLREMPPSYFITTGLLVPSSAPLSPAPFGRGAFTSE